MKRIVATLTLISFVVVMVGCTQTTCPTYSKKAPVEKELNDSDEGNV